MRKIILFIVEGTSDEYALSPLIDKLINQNLVRFSVMRGDITAFPDGIYKNKSIEERLEIALKKYLAKNRPLRKKDIEKIIFVTDTDGVFIPDSLIYEKEDQKSFYYQDNGLYCQIKENAIKRNQVKKENLTRIVEMEFLDDIPLEAYYFSCNLDDTLYGEKNLSSRLKEDYADDFSENFYLKEEDFINFIFQDDIANQEEYYSSWDYIKESNHSLLRGSNFHIFFIRNYDALSDKSKIRLSNFI